MRRDFNFRLSTLHQPDEVFDAQIPRTLCIVASMVLTVFAASLSVRSRS